MSRILIALTFTLLIPACAQRSDSTASGETAGSWKSFVGKLQTPEGTCHATYLGTESHLVNILGAASSDKRKHHYVLTAYHCIKGYKADISAVTVNWLAGDTSQGVGLYKVGDENAQSLDDVAVFIVDGPGKASPFSSTLASTLGKNQTVMREAANGEVVTIAAVASDGKTYACHVLETQRTEAGFQIQCGNLEPEVAKGMSGALVVSMRGDPLGVFLATKTGETGSYFVHSLANGSLAGGYWTMRSTAAEVESAEDSLENRLACKGVLGAGCLRTATPTVEEVDAFFASWANGGLGCTKSWIAKTWAATGNTNGSQCGFKDTSDGGLKSRAEEILREDDDRSCTDANGNSCKAGTAGCYITGTRKPCRSD